MKMLKYFLVYEFIRWKIFLNPYHRLDLKYNKKIDIHIIIKKIVDAGNK